MPVEECEVVTLNRVVVSTTGSTNNSKCIAGGSHLNTIKKAIFAVAL
jgi:hypothetical protein